MSKGIHRYIPIHLNTCVLGRSGLKIENIDRGISHAFGGIHASEDHLGALEDGSERLEGESPI